MSRRPPERAADCAVSSDRDLDQAVADVPREVGVGHAVLDRLADGLRLEVTVETVLALAALRVLLHQEFDLRRLRVQGLEPRHTRGLLLAFGLRRLRTLARGRQVGGRSTLLVHFVLLLS